MQLKIRRSQRDGGLVSTKVIFCLDARVDFTAQEQQHITRYKLHNQIIYNSEASRRFLERSDAQDQRSLGGSLKSLAFTALAAMRLNISIAGLQRGQHIECKSLDELLGAEEAIMTACENLKGYLDTAATFDGREILFDFATGSPTAIAHSGLAPPALAVAPTSSLPPSQGAAMLPAPAVESDPPPAPWSASSPTSRGDPPLYVWWGLTDGQMKLMTGVLYVALLMILVRCGQR